ncbi:FAD-dependent monooxygenase [Streptomyces brevispora]|uniref:FAD-dependent monooxygenase n=1 Tax=Streptomyces brevispora TaxID=887462 RepID=UPI0037189B4B
MSTGNGATSRHPVLVVGAGPAGLTAALALRAAGLPAVVLDRRDQDTVRPGSRAAYLHGASLRELERLSPGLGQEIAGRGLMWSTKRSLWAGREIYARTCPPLHREGLPPFTSLPQVQTEDLMATACEKQGVEFHWGVEVTAARTAYGWWTPRAPSGRRST